MMQRCRSNNSHRSPVGPCPCGLFHAPGSSLCVIFGGDGGSSAVDCTLSLSTPSTRSVTDDRPACRPSSRISNLYWDIIQGRHQQQQRPDGGGGAYKVRSGGGGGVQLHNLGEDTLLARRCANCDTTSTPLWRNGPRGPKSLCNACGIRYKKEERRASSTAVEEVHHHQHQPHTYPWAYAAAAQAHKVAAAPAEFSLIQGDDDAANSAVPFLTWRLNVMDTPGLLHDFT